MDLAAVLKPRTRAFSRAARLRASHSYGHVLALVVASFLFAGTAPDGGWTSSALLVAMCATFVTALWTSGLVQLGSRPSVWITAGAAVVAVLQILVDGDTLAGIVALLTAALAVMTIAVIALGVADQREVNAQSISGAICVYFLLGLLFVFLYGAAAVLGDGAFFAQGIDGTRALRVYFSFVTLATLGYGDYTPAGDAGHMLAVVEALVGQIYLVTVVALLVSRVGRGSGSA